MERILHQWISTAVALFIAAAGLLAAPAWGQGIVTFASTGTIGAGVDELGLFGTAGGTLDGQAFSLSISVDTSLLVHKTSNWPDTDNWRELGSDPARAALATGAVTVAGHSYAWTIDDAQARLVLAMRGEHSPTMPDLATVGASGTGADGASLSAMNEIHSVSRQRTAFIDDLDFSHDRVFDTGQTLVLSSAIFHAMLQPGQGGNDGDTTLLTYFQSAGTLETASWTSVSPVPEPRAWAMLAAGIGLLALARRHRRGRA